MIVYMSGHRPGFDFNFRLLHFEISWLDFLEWLSVFPFCRYCVCTVCFGTRKMLKPMRKHFLDQHPANCSCDCPTCSSNSCRPEALDVNWLQSHFLCPKQPLLYGSDHNYNQWKCIELKCDACFLNKPSIILCDRSGFTDDTNVMKWEKWEQLDYTRRNLVRPLALQQPGIPVQPVGFLCVMHPSTST